MSSVSKTNAWQAEDDERAWCVIGSGAATSVGLGFPASMAAARAGISRCVQHPFLLHEDLEPVTTAHASYLPVALPGPERSRALCEKAAREALRYLPAHAQSSGFRVRTLLSSAVSRDGANAPLHEALFQTLREALGSVAQGDHVLDETGHAGGIRLLAENADASVELLVLAGVDSYLDPVRVRTLARDKLLRSDENPWGMVPGEAASVLLLVRARLARELSLPVLGWLLAAACAFEPFPADQGGVCTGQGLSWAFDGASGRAFSAGAVIDDVYCDLNGHPARVDELGFTLTRFSNRFRDPGRFMAPANCWGDVGAASAPLLAQLALASWQRGFSRGELAMVWTSSGLGPARGAMLLRKPRGDER